MLKFNPNFNYILIYCVAPELRKNGGILTEEDLIHFYLNRNTDINGIVTLSKHFNKIITFKVGDKFSIRSMDGYHNSTTKNMMLIQYTDNNNRQYHIFTNEQMPMRNHNNDVVIRNNTSYAKNQQNIHQEYNGGIIIGEEFDNNLNGKLAKTIVNTYNGISKSVDLFDNFITSIS